MAVLADADEGDLGVTLGEPRPDARKASAVRACVEGPVSPLAPASILQTHAATTLYLDRDSAAELRPATRGAVVGEDEP
jgi:hypothetical protein